MFRIARPILKTAAALTLLSGLALAVVVLGFAFLSRSKHPPLAPWHRLDLEEEFHAGRADVKSFEDYLRLEDRLFAELHKRLLDDPSAADPFVLGRYHAGSPAAQRAWDTRYNRSFELKQDHPVGAVLLVHGLSDSPYSMRAIADTFYEQGYDVVALRLPGHGTTPSMLKDISWQDWYAAVDLAARYTQSRAGPGKPFLAGGHSTGAALVTLYALRSLDDPSLPRPSRLYLMSPAIGIDDLAFMTNVLAGLSSIPYFESSAWLDVLPEYDPYKYNSFPVNAGKQIYRVTRELSRAFAREGEAGKLGGMPHVTVFHSLVDATVKSVDVVKGLLALLPDNGNELVVFDVNRTEKLQGLIASAPIAYLEKLRAATDAPFRITLVANRSADSADVATYSRPARSSKIEVADLPLAWPAGVVSLGHVAIPFPPDDPVYGLTPAADGMAPYPLGAFSARGENGALVVPLDLLARLRSNPFFDVIRATVERTCREDSGAR
ncbi:MAG TPA: alpha/beta fold hydrolase [Candidatus Polarisedimenticolaceae bacterium]|nr:alpha/beta fold hydrolase [Candidatus Polarisedimenticolaceae bacterium]